jgi:hypothetical protein
MVRRSWSVSPLSLGRALDTAVGRALVSAAAAGAGAACAGRSAGEGVESLSPAFSFSGAATDGAGAPGSGSGEVEGERAATVQDRSEQACAPEGASRFAHMELAEPYGFVALRAVNAFDATSVESTTELEPFGQPCAGASDVEACRAELARAWPVPGGDWTECGQGGCVTYGVVSVLGDRVQLHDALPEIVSLLGEIDTPVEAVFWADANGYQPRCVVDSIFQLPRVELLEIEGGYRLRNYEMIADCPIEYQGVALDMARDGRLEVVDRFAAPRSNISAVSAAARRGSSPPPRVRRSTPRSGASSRTSRRSKRPR